MYSYKSFFQWVLLLTSVAVLAGCGGGSNQIAPPAKGNFTNASLSGSYAFAVTGTNSGGFFALAGSLQANGNGTITGGVEDINSPGTAVVRTNVGITGTYTVRADGRTTATLIPAAGSGLNNITLDFVLLSSQSGLVVRFDNAATASGTIDLENSGAFSNAALAGALAFNLSGVDGSGLSLGTAGTITTDASGNITSGVQDVNDNGTVSTNLVVTPAAGAMSDPSTGRGTVSISTNLGTFNFAFYVVDANHIKLISTDASPVLSGDAFRQQGPFSNASASGPFVLTLTGAIGGGPFVAGAVITSDGAGNITGTEDANRNGTVNTNFAVTGTYSIASNGRGTLTTNSGIGTANFAIYPSTGGLQILELDAIANGVAVTQPAGAISNSTITGRYGLNLSGVDLNNQTEFDAAAQFTADGNGNLTGTLDLNNSGTLTLGLALSGTYNMNANGRGTGTLRTANNTLNVVFYAAGGAKVVFIEIDNIDPAVGVFQQQQ
jgi:hypothetical protein